MKYEIGALLLGLFITWAIFDSMFGTVERTGDRRVIFRHYGGIYELYWTEVLWGLANNGEPVSFPIEHLEGELTANRWNCNEPKQAVLRPYDLFVARNVTCDHHIDDTVMCDLQYPIVILDMYTMPQPQRRYAKRQYNVLDGVHRLSRAVYLDELEFISAVVFTWEQIQVARIPKHVAQVKLNRDPLTKKLVHHIHFSK